MVKTLCHYEKPHPVILRNEVTKNLQLFRFPLRKRGIKGDFLPRAISPICHCEERRDEAIREWSRGFKDSPHHPWTICYTQGGIDAVLLE